MKKFFYKRTHIPSGETWVLESEHHTERAFINSLVTWTRWADLTTPRVWEYVDATEDCTEAEVDLTSVAKLTVEAFAERAQETFRNSVLKLMEEYMLRELAKWQKNFPKRVVSIMDSQFSTGVYVDGEFIGGHPLDVDNRMVAMFEPLFNVVDWYINFADQYDVEIGAVTIAPKGTGTDARWIHERIEYV